MMKKPPSQVLRLSGRGLGLAVCLALTAGAAPAPSSLRIVARYAVPGEPSSPTDVRWAGENSVYLARFEDGVSEVKLSPGLPVVRTMVPSRAVGHLAKYFWHVAAADGVLAFADRDWTLGWRPIQTPVDRNVVFKRRVVARTAGLDLHGDRLLLLGAGFEEDLTDRYDEAGGFAGFGKLTSNFRDLTPLRFDPEGRGSPRLSRCGVLDAGGARFLQDGSMFIVPVAEPGAFLYDAEGALLRSWTDADLGVDDLCSGVTKDVAKIFFGSAVKRRVWRSSHRVVDAVLPLPQGPTIIVRTLVNGKPSWQMKVLGSGGITTYAIPVPDAGPNDRLTADARSGRIVVLRREQGLSLDDQTTPGEILVAELPTR